MAPDAVETADSAADPAAPEAPGTGAPAAKAADRKSAERAEKPAKSSKRASDAAPEVPQAETQAEQPEPAPARAGRDSANASKKKELDILAELGEEEPAKAKEPVAKGDLSLDDLVLPEREGGSRKKSAAKKTAEEEPAEQDESPRLPATALLFQAPEITPRSRRRKPAQEDEPVEPKGGEGKSDPAPKKRPKSEEPDQGAAEEAKPDTGEDDESDQPRRRRRRGGRGRRRGGQGGQGGQPGGEGTAASGSAGAGEKTASGKNNDKKNEKSAKPEPEKASAKDEGEASGEESSSSRRRRRRSRPDSGQAARDQVTPLKGSTRLEAKRQRRREGRDARRRRTIITEAEFLARRESVERKMYVREGDGRTQIVVLEDDVLVEHYVAQKSQTSMVGNVYLGRVQNVLPSMEAAFVDIGRGRNAVLYAGEVNWDAAGLEGQPRRIEQALKSGDFVLVQVTKDPIGTKGARLTAQVTLAGRFLVLVPNGSMTGISRKLPESERNRLKKLLKDLVPEGQGVIVRTAAEGASEEQLKRDIDRLASQWAEIEKKQAKGASSPVLVKGEPELATRVVRDIFNEDFSELVISGETAWKTLSEYVNSVASDLADRMTKWTKKQDVFAAHRIDEQLTKGTDRKVYLPSGGSLVIDRTEAMTVVDVNTGKYTGSGGTLEETVTKNNLEAAEEIVRQLRLRDIGGIIVIDFIDMVLESNRELVLRRLVECLGRDRTRHQVAEVTSLGLVQMTRKRVGQGLVEAFSTPCECCNGRGFIVHNDPVEEKKDAPAKETAKKDAPEEEPEDDPQREQLKATLQAIAAAASSAHEEDGTGEQEAGETAEKADPA
ncbi:MAG TPA: Rne/Rng family ribonuclease [Beutenbergiaceae bacterium]|nr:Rne/Rng family ribonuclease [Beutenbergiaceae bacterium]